VVLLLWVIRLLLDFFGIVLGLIVVGWGESGEDLVRSRSRRELLSPLRRITYPPPISPSSSDMLTGRGAKNPRLD